MYRNLKVICGSSHKEFSYAVARSLGISVTEVETFRFSNENFMVKIKENVREADVFVVQTSCTPVSDGIMELFLMLDALRNSSAKRITAVIPYYPYVRSDKKDQPRISIAARLMANLLETAGADRILTMDLHSPQIQGFFNFPSDQLFASNIICDYIKTLPDWKNFVIVAADVGEAKHLGKFANILNLPMAIIDKRRIGNTDNIEPVYVIGDVKGKKALILDDEVSTANTLCKAAIFLMEKGASSVSCAIVHPVLSGNAVKNINAAPIDELIFTDTIPLGDKLKECEKKITVLSVAALFAKSIERIHDGRSISDLF